MHAARARAHARATLCRALSTTWLPSLQPLARPRWMHAAAPVPAPSASPAAATTPRPLWEGISGRVLPILEYPHDLLRAKATELPDVGAPPVRQLVADLLATATARKCMGVAAPQLGAPVRAFVVLKPRFCNEDEAVAFARRVRAASGSRRPRLARRSGAAQGAQVEEGPARTVHPDGTPMGPDSFTVVINPVIESKSEDVVIGLEGCLSVPDAQTLVRRSKSVVVSYTDACGQRVTERLSNLPAVVFQHEYDHLEGVLQTDREVRVLPGALTKDDAFADAHQRWMLELMQFYGIGDVGSVNPEA